ncbi:Pirin domain protein [Actinacidiphila cocklensis]|uniref:Pirin domain protein n=2 Tax=Actinacidiphila cocklensis TaxID=887465 RepID=A0A9W4DLG5_9ACTN|nr:Pirin domain protein [Actinacidiphila cocklensis]
MSSTESDPAGLLRGDAGEEGPARQGTHVEVLTARDVPLGGPRAMTVRRTLPQRARTTIGAWCFADHYGPDSVAESGGMDVAPHPHIGLQTVSWLFSGEIEHRDSLGTHAYVRPGELNLMTGGHGICHSEVSTAATSVLHGVQLWVALPAGSRDVPRDFQHHVPRPVPIDGGEARVFLGSLAGDTSPVPTFSPLLGAEIIVHPGATAVLAVDPGFEHGLLVDSGTISFAGTPLRPAELGYHAPGTGTLTLTNTGETPARTILLGGTPFDEQIVMWWNFVGRSHEEIVAAREAWQRNSGRFGRVEGYDGDRIPAPVLPNATLTPRRNPERPTPERQTMTSPTDPVVELAEIRQRYEILADGRLAGFTEYRDRGVQRVFFHTDVDAAFAGRGLASVLVQQALSDVRKSGMRIVPVCPYVAKFLQKHDEFADITDVVTPEIRHWLRTQLD